MKTVLRLALALWLLAAPVFAAPSFPVPAESRQLVVVLSDGWDAPTARMYRFERESAQGEWSPIGQVVTVNLGRTGLAWGRSELIKDAESGSGPQKREGDGKSPAGLFPFLKGFGHPAKPAGYSSANLPFLVVEHEQCVDDGASPYYNQIVKPSEVGGRTWKSAEDMKIGLYEMGLVVGHNCPAAKPGMGSCIFYHLQSGANCPTSGCTAMDRGSLTNLLLWLKRDAKPVVLQLPRAEFSSSHDPSWPEIR